MKDHEIAELVNKLRDVAIEFHGAQQLRSRIQDVVLPALAASAPKVQMTDLEIIEIATATRTAESNKDGGYILPISFARAILARSAPNAELVAALQQVMRPYGIYDLAVSKAGGLQDDFMDVGKQIRAALAAVGEA